MNIFTRYRDEINRAVIDLAAESALPSGLDLSRVAVDPPRDSAHGDLSTNAAMVLSKQAGLASAGGDSGALLLNRWYIAALVALVLQAGTWTMALRLNPLSVAYPFMSLSLVIGVLAGVFLFDEGITLPEVVGTLIIAIGILVLHGEPGQKSA